MNNLTVVISCILLTTSTLVYNHFVNGQENDATTVNPNSDALRDYIHEEVERRVKQTLEEAIQRGTFVKQKEVTDLKIKNQRYERRLNVIETMFLNVYNELLILKKCDPCRTEPKKANFQPTLLNETKYSSKVTTAPSVITTLESIIHPETNSQSATRTNPVTTERPDFRRLYSPKLEVDVKFNNKHKRGWLFVGRLYEVAALQHGGAAIRNSIYYNQTDLLWQVDSYGLVVKLLYSCQKCSFTGMKPRQSDILIFHGNGTIVQVDLDSAAILQTYNVPYVKSMRQWGHPADYEDPNQDVLLLADYAIPLVFTYKLSNQAKQVKIVTGLRYPERVFKQIYNSSTYFVVGGDSRVRIYNNTGDLIRETGTGYHHPVPSPEGDIIFLNRYRRRISVLDMAGNVKYNLLTNIYANSMYSKYPYLWVSYNGDVYRYRIYKGY